MKNLITPTAIFLTALILTFSGVSYFKTQRSVGIALPQAVGVFETSLQTGITSTATTMTLTANSIRGGGSLSGFNCFSADEGNSNAEVICGTVSGTTVSGLTRGISYEDGETEVSGNKYSHRRGANIKITDFPIIQRLKAQNNGDSTFVNQLQYESYLTPTDDADIISKKYADDLAIAGSPDATLSIKGIVEMASQAGMASTSVAGTGDTTAWLALSATYATSTPTIRGLYVPVSENDGYLSQLWTRLSDAYTWTGAHIFSSTVNISGATTLTGLFSSSATSTMATTTVTKFTASADTANPIYLNGIDYAFPSTESASSTVLSTDGSGNLSWNEQSIFKTIASDTLQASADTERSHTGNTVLTLKKEIDVRYSGTVRVTYDTKNDTGGTVATELRDGVGNVLASSSHANSSYTAQSHDVNVVSGTQLKLYISNSNSGNISYVQNYRVKFTKSITTDTTVITN